MKVIKNFTKVLVMFYLLTCLFLWTTQESIIFNPYKLQGDSRFKSEGEISIEVEENIFLSGLWIKERESRGVILYLHGNKRSISRSLQEASSLSNLGYDVFMIDYRGFGKSDGRICSEKQLFSDAQIVYDYLKKDYREKQIIVVGFSLGTGIASWLATNNNPNHLILVAPYINFFDLKSHYFTRLIPDFLVKYPLNNKEHLKNVTCSVTLFHGTKDGVIPFDSSEELVKINPLKIKLIPLKDEIHNKIMTRKKLRKEMELCIKSLAFSTF